MKTIVVSLLEQLGYRVVSVDSARAALDFIEQSGEADLVFSEVMLPGEMNGVELVKSLRAQKPALQVLLTSGYADALTRNQGVPILRKPYRMAALAEAVHAMLAAKRA